MAGIFPSSLFKTTMVVAAFKEDYKLDYTNYHPISLLKNVCIKDYVPFHSNSNIIYNLQFGFRQHFLQLIP